MKMVSQLTRQAMNRHRTLHPLYPAPTPPLAAPYLPPEPPARPFLPSAPQPASVQPSLQERQPVPAPQPPRVRTIYQQLMNSHDRMTERHLKRT